MENKSAKIEILVAIGLVLLIVVSRLSNHFWNFTVVGGAALFAGAYFSKKYFSVAVIFSGLLISDAVIGFHNQMIAVYLGYALVAAVGFFLTIQSGRAQQTLTAMLSACLFYLVTNFAVWYEGMLYPMNFDGLMLSYYMGLPFFRNQFISDVISAVVLFQSAKYFKLPAAATKAVQIKF